jgi:hypothetical protein
VRQFYLATFLACRIGAGFIKSGMGKTPRRTKAEPLFQTVPPVTLFSRVKSFIRGKTHRVNTP